MTIHQMKEKIEAINQAVHILMQDLIGYADNLEDLSAQDAGEGLRAIVGELENWSHNTHNKYRIKRRTEVIIEPIRYPAHEEPLAMLDREPIPTRLPFTFNKSEENMSMNKTEFIVFMIKHHENFPNLYEIDLNTAQKYLAMIDPAESVPDISAEEFMTAWNVFVHDPKVMEE